MAELTTSPTTFPLTNDSWAGLTPNSTEIMAEAINGLASAVLSIEGFSANTATSILTRLNASHNAFGGIQRGVSFPVSPTPVDGQLFILNDELFAYNATTAQWETVVKIPLGFVTGAMIATGTITGVNVAAGSLPDSVIQGVISKAKLIGSIAYEDEQNQFVRHSHFLEGILAGNEGGEFSMARVSGGVLQTPAFVGFQNGNYGFRVDGVQRLAWEPTAGVGGVARLLTGEVPPANLSAGALPAVVTVPPSNLTGGTLPAGVAVAPTNLSAGTLPAGVIVPTANTLDILSGADTVAASYTTSGVHFLGSQVIAVTSSTRILAFHGFTFDFDVIVPGDAIYARIYVVLTGPLALLNSLNGLSTARVSTILLRGNVVGTTQNSLSGSFSIWPILPGNITVEFYLRIGAVSGGLVFNLMPIGQLLHKTFWVTK